jgi:hypothetical protein
MRAMARNIIFENEDMTVWENEENRVVSHCIYRPVTGAVFRDALLAGAELLRRKGYVKWLSDDRKNRTITGEDKKWTFSEWERLAIAAGWKYWALIPSEDADGQMDLQETIDEYSKAGVIVRVFSEPELALQWLQGCEERGQEEPTRA